VIDTGVLELVDNAIDQTTGSIKLKATFPNHTRQLWPGGFANVRMLLATHADAMTIPTVAIQRGPQGAYVFVYQPESATVALTVVEAGISNGEETEILKGLREGDAVVVDGMAKLQDKSKVVKSDKGEERGKGEKSGKSVEDEKEEKSIKSEKSEKAPPPANEKPVTDLAEKSNDKKPHGGE